MAKEKIMSKTELLITGDAVTFQNAVTQTLYHKVTELLDARKQEIARDVLVGESISRKEAVKKRLEAEKKGLSRAEIKSLGLDNRGLEIELKPKEK
jgi:hypothetical protein